MTPIGKYIIIKKIDNEEAKTESGLYLSGRDQDDFRYQKGKVVKPGTDVASINDDDVIFYDKSQSFTMVINEEQYTIIQERDVVVVL
ncbi:MAG: Cpn10 [Podoviridae sp. ctrTa16]|nr:MAG: Cpn10 [Podoviridae sp. ctrTa16]